MDTDSNSLVVALVLLEPMVVERAVAAAVAVDDDTFRRDCMADNDVDCRSCASIYHCRSSPNCCSDAFDCTGASDTMDTLDTWAVLDDDNRKLSDILAA